MKNSVVLNGNVDGQFYANEVLKLTSLIYLKEALLTQQFENCAALIREAKIFGAQQKEISDVIAEALGGVKGGAYEAKQKGQDRTRF